MQVRLAKKTRKPQRGGFTLIELLVVISIIAVLASLILPGVQNARESARRLKCFNNMRNVGMAVLGYATANNGAFPPLAGGGDCWQLTANDAAVVKAPAPWTVHLLPYLEQQGLYDSLNVSTNPGIPTLQGLRNVNVEVFTCPDDLSSDEPGAFSFAANAGYMGSSLFGSAETVHSLNYYTWSPSGSDAGTQAIDYAKRAAATGIFFREESTVSRANTTASMGSVPAVNPLGIKITVDRIRDGSSQTLMLSENLNNGQWLPTCQVSSTYYLGPATGDLGFVLAVDDSSTSGTPNATLQTIGAGTYTLPSASPDLTGCRINNNLNATSGLAPRPGSFHPQIVNAIFCDGHGKTLNQSISDNVYARLISSNGNLSGQKILSSTDF